ncbi:MAG: tetratricopeptide repeat protein [Gammaproteobacteria bacterium]
MKNHVLLVFTALSLWITGCTVTQPQVIRPAPRNTAVHPYEFPRQAAKKVPPVKRKPAPASKTYAIGDAKSNIRVEPDTPTLRVDPLAPPYEAPASETGVTAESAGVINRNLPAFQVEDARLPSGSSPAVIALLTEANRNQATGDLDAAVVATERALRIDSRNPTLTYKLAQLRIKQNKPRLAEELAGKAALLAGGNSDLKRKSWLLIAEARRLQGNYRGAEDAKAKAESFSGHW